MFVGAQTEKAYDDQAVIRCDQFIDQQSRIIQESLTQIKSFKDRYRSVCKANLIDFYINT